MSELDETGSHSTRHDPQGRTDGNQGYPLKATGFSFLNWLELTP